MVRNCPVLVSVGATLPGRDKVDVRIIEETRNGYATYEGASYKKDRPVADRPGRAASSTRRRTSAAGRS